MSEKSQLTHRLQDWKYRESYIRSKINVNLPSQIRALRIRQNLTQGQLADHAHMRQPRISAMETPGATNFNVETLVRVAAALKVGLVIKFVPVSEMVEWENAFSQDRFNVVPFDKDKRLQPATIQPIMVQPAASNAFVMSVPASVDWMSPAPGKALRRLPEYTQELASMTDPPKSAGEGTSTATTRQIQVFAH